MTRPRILVAAATGGTGIATVSQLLEKGHLVRALVHREDARAARLRERGAEIVVGSMTDYVDMERALADVQRAYFCAPTVPGYLTSAAVFAALAKQSKLESLVVMSQWLSDPTHPSLHTRECYLADRIFEALPGVAVTFNNVGFFANNYFYALDPIVQMGVLPIPLGDGLNAPPSNEDIARVNVAALVDPRAHGGKTYRPTGPTLLSPQQIAETFAKVLGRPVAYKPVSLAFFGKVIQSMAVVHEYSAAIVLHYFSDYAKNAFAVGSPTDVVEAVAGRPAEDFETIIRRYVAEGNAAPQLSAKLGQVFTMMKAIVTSPPRMDRFNQMDHFSNPGHAQLSADSLRWRATHDPSGQLGQFGEARAELRLLPVAR